VKAKLTASGEIKSTTKEEIRDEVKVIEENSVRTTFTPGPDRVGLEIVPVHVFEGACSHFSGQEVKRKKSLS
jgi:hypothetical protein